MKRRGVCIRLCVMVIPLVCNWRLLAADTSGEDLRDLGRKAFKHGQYDDAEQYLRQSLAVFEAQRGGSDVEVGITRGDLGSLLVIENRLAEAEPQLESALGVLSKSRVQDCKDIVQITNHLAILYSTTHRYERAEAAFQKSIGQIGGIDVFPLLQRLERPDQEFFSPIVVSLLSKPSQHASPLSSRQSSLSR